MRASCCAAVVALLVLPMGAGSARAQCTYPGLTSGTAVSASVSPTQYQFNQTQRFWTAIAVRPASGDDWDLSVYQATDVAPACVTGLLATSAAPAGVDLVVGDFNTGHNALGVHYPAPLRIGGTGDARLEWDAGANALLVNGPLVARTTSPDDVVEIWDVQLNGGVTYTLHFAPSGADLKLLVFKSGAGAYWAGRSSALVETATTATFVAPSTGFYGVAVVNDDGADGAYTLGVGRCDSPTALTSGTTVTTTLAEKYYSFNQPATYWTAVGARGAANWNVDVYRSAAGGDWPVCFSGLLGASAEAAPAVDFVVGNFNVLKIGTYYARVHLQDGQGSGTATAEWDNGLDVLFVDSTEVAGSTGATDVLQVWDAYLEKGTTYYFTLNATGAAMKLFVYSPTLPAGWGGRAAAALISDAGAGTVEFTPDSSDWHGVVVTNENGASGTYTVRIQSSVVAVDDPITPAVTRLERVFPNPGRGALTLQFSMHEPGAVAFDVVDVTGRMVSESAGRVWPAGRWSQAWDGRGRTGVRLGAGVYFVRMRVGERLVARQKVVLLD
jgi:hypothetical protein